LWLLLREVNTPSRANAIGLGVVVAAGGLTHYFFAPVALTALIWAAADPAARACRRAVVVAVAVGGAIAAAWAPVMLVQYRRDRFWWIGPFDLRQVVAAAIVVAGIVLVLPFDGAASSAPPFGVIAHALVAEGWRPSDPLAVFGNFFVYRAPLEWYLPGSPRLDAARPRPRACRTVFV